MAGITKAKSSLIKEKVEGLSIFFFQELETALKSEDKAYKMDAMKLLRPLIERLIPQDVDITSDGKPIFLPAELLTKNGLAVSPDAEPGSEK